MAECIDRSRISYDKQIVIHNVNCSGKRPNTVPGPQKNRGQHVTRITAPRETVFDFNMRGPMWAMHGALARLPRALPQGSEDRLRLLEEELAVKDLLVRYTYFYDAGDLDGVMAV